MFKKFTAEEDVSGYSQAKMSVARGIRTRLLEQCAEMGPYVDTILPKKEALGIIKCHDHIEIMSSQGELLFFRQRDGPYIPTLRLLHKYPFLLPHVQVDKGAIKFILSGANIMCPGLTSPGARMDVDLPEESIVVSLQRPLPSPPLPSPPLPSPSLAADKAEVYVKCTVGGWLVYAVEPLCSGVWSSVLLEVKAVMAEGMQHAVAIGRMKLSTEQIRKVNKGVGVENVHYLCDGLWIMKNYQK